MTLAENQMKVGRARMLLNIERDREKALQRIGMGADRDEEMRQHAERCATLHAQIAAIDKHMAVIEAAKPVVTVIESTPRAGRCWVREVYVDGVATPPKGGVAWPDRFG